MPVPKPTLEMICKATAEGIVRILKPHPDLRRRVGYAVMIFELEGSGLSYNSNCQSGDMVRLLRELANLIVQGKEPRKVILQ